MDERTHLLTDLDQARQRMRNAIEGLDFHKEIYPGWTLKEVLAHITGWDDATISSLHAHLADDVPATPASRGINYYNAQTVAERDSLPFDLIKKEWEKSRDLLKSIVMTMPDHKFKKPLVFPWGQSGTITDIIHIFTEHEEEHAHEIERLIHNK